MHSIFQSVAPLLDVPMIYVALKLGKMGTMMLLDQANRQFKFVTHYSQGRIQGGVFRVWRPPFQSVTYSKVSTSINYFTGAV